jgi:hypothetical protein
VLYLLREIRLAKDRRSLGKDDAKIWIWVAENDEAMTIWMSFALRALFGGLPRTGNLLPGLKAYSFPEETQREDSADL